MDKKAKRPGYSESPEVEELRVALIALGRKATLDLAKDAKLNPITADKFRRRMITDLGADKFLALRQAFVAKFPPTPVKHNRRSTDKALVATQDGGKPA